MALGQAEVTRDEFGGYCCKRWGTADQPGDEIPKKSDKSMRAAASAKNASEQVTEDNICKLLGLDIEKSALEIVKADFKRKKIPFSKAGKYLAASNPYSMNSSAAKSYNASASQSASKPILVPTQSRVKAETIETSAFLTYGEHTTPYKRARVDSNTFAPTQVPSNDVSAQSKQSANVAQTANETFGKI